MAVKNKQFMEKAIELASRGFGAVEPNPMVGCVIVKDGQVLGQGWHKQFGEAHAEINALQDCKNRGHDPEGATVCVTLEPCCHHGKTPPCTEALINAKVAKVVIAMLDPSDKVAGKGVKQLEEAGITVSIGACRKQAELLNPAFIKFSLCQKPWVVLKWAQTIDGKLSGESLGEEHRWISSESSRKDVHKLRRSVQAILVGVKTVIVDDPMLTPRPSKGKTLTRIVVDSSLRIPLDCKLLNSPEDGPVIIATTQKAFNSNIEKVSQLTQRGAEVIALPQNYKDHCDLNELIEDLGRRGVQRLLVEGGASVIGSFIEEDLADEAIIYVAPKIFAGKGSVGIYTQLDKLDKHPQLHYTETSIFEQDVRFKGLFRRLTQIGR